jgi:hypothetical protein
MKKICTWKLHYTENAQLLALMSCLDYQVTKQQWEIYARFLNLKTHCMGEVLPDKQA